MHHWKGIQWVNPSVSISISTTFHFSLSYRFYILFFFWQWSLSSFNLIHKLILSLNFLLLVSSFYRPLIFFILQFNFHYQLIFTQKAYSPIWVVCSSILLRKLERFVNIQWLKEGFLLMICKFNGKGESWETKLKFNIGNKDELWFETMGFDLIWFVLKVQNILFFWIRYNLVTIQFR